MSDFQYPGWEEEPVDVDENQNSNTPTFKYANPFELKAKQEGTIQQPSDEATQTETSQEITTKLLVENENETAATQATQATQATPKIAGNYEITINYVDFLVHLLTAGNDEVTDGNHSSTDGNHSNTDGNHSSTDGNHSSTDDNHSSTDGNHSSTDGNHSSTDDDSNPNKNQVNIHDEHIGESENNVLRLTLIETRSRSNAISLYHRVRQHVASTAIGVFQTALGTDNNGHESLQENVVAAFDVGFPLNVSPTKLIFWFTAIGTLACHGFLLFVLGWISAYFSEYKNDVESAWKECGLINIAIQISLMGISFVGHSIYVYWSRINDYYTKTQAAHHMIVFCLQMGYADQVMQCWISEFWVASTKLTVTMVIFVTLIFGSLVKNCVDG